MIDVDKIVKSRAFEVFMKFHALILVVIGFLIGIAAPVPGTYLSKVDMGGICFPSSSSSAAASEGDGPGTSASSPNCVFNKVNHIPIAIIFLISGLGLEISQIKKAFGKIKIVMGGLSLILIITPMLSILVFTSIILSAPPDFAFGLGLFLLCPTTLATGVATTKVANGNIPLSIILTVASNLIGVITVPLAISLTVPEYIKFLDSLNLNSTTTLNDDNGGKPSLDVSIDPVPLITVLFFSVFIPILIGIALRAKVESLSKFAKAHKSKLGFFSNVMLGSITWMQSSASSKAFTSISFPSLIAILFVFGLVHLAYLVICAIFARYVLRCDSDDFKAVVIMGMQKSLAMCLTLLSMLPQDITPSIGMASIPVIVSQLVQTIFDSYVASMWTNITFPQYKPLSSKANQIMDESSPTDLQSNPINGGPNNEHPR